MQKIMPDQHLSISKTDSIVSHLRSIPAFSADINLTSPMVLRNSVSSHVISSYNYSEASLFILSILQGRIFPSHLHLRQYLAKKTVNIGKCNGQKSELDSTECSQKTRALTSDQLQTSCVSFFRPAALSWVGYLSFPGISFHICKLGDGSWFRYRSVEPQEFSGGAQKAATGRKERLEGGWERNSGLQASCCVLTEGSSLLFSTYG